MIEYKANCTYFPVLLTHLIECDHLTDINVSNYAQKINQLANTFEAWEGETLVGLVAIYLNDSPTGFITNVSVLPKYRNKRIASKLLKTAIEKAKYVKFSLIKLEVKDDNPVLKLYQSLGFKIIEREKDILTMQLNLKESK